MRPLVENALQCKLLTRLCDNTDASFRSAHHAAEPAIGPSFLVPRSRPFDIFTARGSHGSIV